MGRYLRSRTSRDPGPPARLAALGPALRTQQETATCSAQSWGTNQSSSNKQRGFESRLLLLSSKPWPSLHPL